MKKDIIIATKAIVGGALDWEVYLGPISAFFITVIQYCFGPIDFILNLLAWSFVADYVTGYFKASLKGELSSRKGSVGFLRKIGKLLIIVLCVQASKVLGGSLVRNIVMGGYISNEWLSIIENGEACGIIPSPVAKYLAQYQKKLSSLTKLDSGGE